MYSSVRFTARSSSAEAMRSSNSSCFPPSCKNFRLSWIYEQTRREALPMAKFGNHVRIPRDKFLDYLRNGSR